VLSRSSPLSPSRARVDGNDVAETARCDRAPRRARQLDVPGVFKDDFNDDTERSVGTEVQGREDAAAPSRPPRGSYPAVGANASAVAARMVAASEPPQAAPFRLVPGTIIAQDKSRHDERRRRADLRFQIPERTIHKSI
jgi:hypothetical protein